MGDLNGIPPPLHYEHILSPSEFGGIVFTFLAVAILTTIIRIYYRSFILHAFGVDDFLIIIGTLGTIAIVCLEHEGALYYDAYYYASEKVGHMIFMTKAGQNGFTHFIRYGGIADIVYMFTLPFLKCSILAFYVRIAAKRRHVQLLYGLIAIVAIQGIIFFGLDLASFTPYQSLWDIVAYSKTHNDHQENGLSDSILQIAQGACQVFWDLVLLVLPLPILIKTKLSAKNRVRLVIVYCLSFLSIAGSSVRLSQAIYFRTVETSTGNGFHSLVVRVLYAMWSCIEVTTVVICANLPALHSLVRRATNKSQSSESQYTGSSIVGRFRNRNVTKSSSQPSSKEPGVTEVHDIESGRSDSEGRLERHGSADSEKQAALHE